MLQQRGYYTIVLGDGKKIPLRFCTWTFKRFCELNGNMSIMELQSSLTSMSLSFFVSLVLCGAEYICIKEKREFEYTEMDAADWIDEIGGVASTGFIEMIGVITDTFSDNNANGKEKKIPALQPEK